MKDSSSVDRVGEGKTGGGAQAVLHCEPGSQASLAHPPRCVALFLVPGQSVGDP